MFNLILVQMKQLSKLSLKKENYLNNHEMMLIRGGNPILYSFSCYDGSISLCTVHTTYPTPEEATNYLRDYKINYCNWTPESANNIYCQ